MNLKEFKNSIIVEYASIPLLDIDYILSNLLNIPRLEFFLNDKRKLTFAERDIVIKALVRRSKNEPLQYILNEAPFRNYIFSVGEGVLIPRPETEMLVDLALEHLPVNNSTVCDIGTGSGAIAISIALERANSTVLGVDVSDKALSYATINRDKYCVDNLTLVKSDLFSQLNGEKFNLITANLPYVSQYLYDGLDCEVLCFEPGLALVSGVDGLDLIKKTAKSATNFLHSNGVIIFEFSPEQADQMVLILEECNYKNIQIVNDLTNRARFAVARL